MSYLRRFMILAALLAAVVTGARAASEPRSILTESVRAIDPSRVRAVQALRKEHLGKELEFQIALKMRDFPKLLARLGNGERVSQKEMDERYRPLPAEYQAVIDWAKAQGLTVTQTDPLRL